MIEGSTHHDRRRSLLDATYAIIAEVGFEGLRTRAVALKAGVNIATLHYYFPSKEDLIRAMAEYLAWKFAATHAPPVPSTGVPGVDWLRQEFADAVYYLRSEPELMAVMREVTQRAARDPSVKGVVDAMVEYWKAHLTAMVQKGIDEGTFRKDLTPEQVSSTLIAVLSGIQAVGIDAIDLVRQGIENWLVSPEFAIASQGRANK